MRYPLRWSPQLKQEYGRYWEGRSLWEYFQENVARDPDKVATVDGATRITYSELARHAESLARGLAQLGIGAGDAVAFQLPNWWEATVLHLALVRLSAVTVPIIPIYRDREVSFILRDIEARAIIVPGTWKNFDYAGMVRRVAPFHLRHIITCRGASKQCESLERLLCTPPHKQSVASTDADTLSVVMYTSGTTADPKGVEHTQNTLMFDCASMIHRNELTSDDVILMASPVTHVTGLVLGIMLPLRLGARTIWMDTWNPAQAIRTIEQERVTWTIGATPFLRDLVYCESRPKHDLSSLRLFACGGADMSPKLMADSAAAGIPASRGYGSSEHPSVSGLGGDSIAKSVHFDGCVHDHVQIKIQPVEDGPPAPGSPVVGEICTKGPDLFIGYHHAELNEAAFDADGYFHSGDLGWVDDENYVQVVGRIKDIIVRKGEKFSAKEIEDLLLQHPAVGECVVIGVPDEQRGERVCAVVVLEPGAELSLPEVHEFFGRAGIAKQKYPEQLEIVSAFPRNPSGKVRKFELRDRLSAHATA
jgi:cyclohexanecarboxylate-CoA ligase